MRRAASRALEAAERSWIGRILAKAGGGGAGGGGDVKTTLTYVGASDPAPRADYENLSLRQMPQSPVRLRVADLRGDPCAPAIDKEGFALLRRPSRVTDFTSREQLDTIYRREVEEIVKAETGARRTFTLNHLICRSERHDAGAPEAAAADPPFHSVHSDFTASSAPRLAAEELERRGLPGRIDGRLAFYNVWRSLRPPPQDVSLALCDSRSVSPEDLVPAVAVAIPGTKLREVEYLHYRHSRRHRWCYFPAMEPDEVILFRQYDSGAAQPSACPHSAFTNPSVPKGTPPRLSIEARVLVLFDDG
jgi:hypothetical protein